MKSNKTVFEMVNSVEIVDDGFEDILEFARRCRFSNCTHTAEIDCAIKKAISEGVLPEERFHNYYREKNETEYVSKQKNKTKTIDYMKQRKLFRRK